MVSDIYNSHRWDEINSTSSFEKSGNILNLPTSVQTLLQDFSTDSEELNKSKSEKMSQSLPSLSKGHSDVALERLSNIDKPIDVDAAVTSQLDMVAASITNTLPLKAGAV